jgi:hypothetical protein
MRAYARMANDTQLEMDAAEPRLRAERRLGIMLSQQNRLMVFNKGSLRRGTESEPRDSLPTLADVGVDKKLSARSQKVGSIGEQAFEAVVANVRQRIADQERRANDKSKTP